MLGDFKRTSNRPVRHTRAVRTSEYFVIDVASEAELLASIDAKLGAILTLVLDAYLRDTGVAKPKPRTVDKMLADIGLSSQVIAKLLGKTDRAVNLQLEKDQKASGD